MAQFSSRLWPHKKVIGGIIITVLLGVIYYLFNPGSSSSIFPKCPFLSLTGFKCPGCGSQRAIHNLLHFDIAAAIHYNSLLVFSLPIVGVLLYAEFNRKRKPVFYSKVHNTYFILIYLFIVIGWWILRNIFDF